MSFKLPLDALKPAADAQRAQTAAAARAQDAPAQKDSFAAGICNRLLQSALDERLSQARSDALSRKALQQFSDSHA